MAGVEREPINWPEIRRTVWPNGIQPLGEGLYCLVLCSPELCILMFIIGVQVRELLQSIHCGTKLAIPTPRMLSYDISLIVKYPVIYDEIVV